MMIFSQWFGLFATVTMTVASIAVVVLLTRVVTHLKSIDQTLRKDTK